MAGVGAHSNECQGSALDQEAGAGGLESLSLPHLAHTPHLLWGNVTEEGYVLPRKRVWLPDP